MKNGGRKDKQKIWHTENLKKVIENELKNAEVMQSIAEVLERKTAAIKC